MSVEYSSYVRNKMWNSVIITYIKLNEWIPAIETPLHNTTYKNVMSKG